MVGKREMEKEEVSGISHDELIGQSIEHKVELHTKGIGSALVMI